MPLSEEIFGRAKPEKDRSRHQSTQKERTQSVLNETSTLLIRTVCQTTGAVGGAASSLDPRNAETALLEILCLVRRRKEYNDLTTNRVHDVSHPHLQRRPS